MGCMPSRRVTYTKPAGLAGITDFGYDVFRKAGSLGVHKHKGYELVLMVAGRLQDASLCDDIPPSSDETRALRDACLSDVAAVLEESALCGRVLLAGLRDSCYLEIARTTNDASLCDRIDDPGLNSLCTGDPVVVD